MFQRLGLPELIIILVLVLLIFGSRNLPGLAKSIGSAMREFRQNLSGEQDAAEEKPEDEANQE